MPIWVNLQPIGEEAGVKCLECMDANKISMHNGQEENKFFLLDAPSLLLRISCGPLILQNQQNVKKKPVVQIIRPNALRLCIAILHKTFVKLQEKVSNSRADNNRVILMVGSFSLCLLLGNQYIRVLLSSHQVVQDELASLQAQHGKARSAYHHPLRGIHEWCLLRII